MTFDALTIGLTAVSGVLALVVLLLAYVLGRRTGRTSEDRVSDAVHELEARMEAMVGELGSALERAEQENRRARVLGELSGSLDLEDVLERLVEAARELTGADGALVQLTELVDGRPLVSSLGITPEEAGTYGLAGAPDGQFARAVSVSYRYAEEEAAAGPRVHGGLAVPIAHESAVIGHLVVFSRAAEGGISDDALAELEGLAARAAPAIENARRFREARQLADLDALTGLHNRRYFHETLAREAARAHRYSRRLSLVVLDLDEFKAVNDLIGHLAGDAVLAEAAERMGGVVRSADVPCRIGGDEFAVILPEATLADAQHLCGRIQHAVSAQPIGQAGTVHISAGVAELEEQEDAKAFFQRADDALYRAKEAGRGQVMEASPARGKAGSR
ncbi:MAG: GGDEF domain-containing protein [Gaiellaceae bacterium]